METYYVFFNIISYSYNQTRISSEYSNFRLCCNLTSQRILWRRALLQNGRKALDQTSKCHRNIEFKTSWLTFREQKIIENHFLLQMLIAAFLVPMMVCGTAFFINFIAMGYHASRAIPFGTMVSTSKEQSVCSTFHIYM